MNPAQIGVRGSPAIGVFAEARYGSVVDHLAFFVAPRRVDDLSDLDLLHVSGHDTIDKTSGIRAGQSVLVQRSDVDQCRGVSDGVVFMLVMRLVRTHGVIAGP